MACFHDDCHHFLASVPTYPFPREVESLPHLPLKLNFRVILTSLTQLNEVEVVPKLGHKKMGSFGAFLSNCFCKHLES